MSNVSDASVVFKVVDDKVSLNDIKVIVKGAEATVDVDVDGKIKPQDNNVFNALPKVNTDNISKALGLKTPLGSAETGAVPAVAGEGAGAESSVAASTSGAVLSAEATPESGAVLSAEERPESVAAESSSSAAPVVADGTGEVGDAAAASSPAPAETVEGGSRGGKRRKSKSAKKRKTKRRRSTIKRHRSKQ